MVLFRRQLQIIKMERTPKWLLLVVIIVGAGIFGYFGAKAWKSYPEAFQKLPAAIFKLTEEETLIEEFVQERLDIQLIGEKTYVETAEKGEGLTHLARRTLKIYLQEKTQAFELVPELTPEHKIYIEDYIAKQKGGGWLKLGEKVEISEDLIQEAIEKAENLSPEQLQNLTQYSQLVPSLGY